MCSSGGEFSGLEIAGRLTSAQLSLTNQSTDTLAAAGIGRATPSEIASVIAARKDWDRALGVAAVLLLATATVTPLGLCASFLSASRGLMRTRSRPMIATDTPRETR